MLAALGVTRRYADAVALDGVSLTVPAGRSLAIVGESGSGKTTLLRCFNRMVEPDAGTIEVEGVDVRAQPVVALRRRVGYVPQDGGLLPHWPVLRNAAFVPSLLRWPDAVAAAREALELVGLPAARYGARLPHELSGRPAGHLRRGAAGATGDGVAGDARPGRGRPPG
jgi:osmoprotectant transport system ATP-binding protein